jgi:2-octaprenylphenol hydroxylase
MAIIKTEILIVGAGPVGATLAGLLANEGVQCTLLDARDLNSEPDETDPRGLALTHASKNILSNIRVWDEIPEQCLGKVMAMKVWDENGEGQIKFDANDISHSCLAYIVEQGVLENHLWQCLNDIQSLDFKTGTRVEAISREAERVLISTDKGEQYSARLIVAADGSNSHCRKLAGIIHTEHDYSQTALACKIETELPHQNIARQRFLTGGPLAFLPQAEAHHCSIVWSMSPGRAQELLKIDKDDFKAILESEFDSTLGKIQDVKGLCSFPLKRAYANTYCMDRIVLVGDAAHSIHPLAGQGANLGLLDAACLAEVILQAKVRHRDPGARLVLRKYERWRKGENMQMMWMMDGFKYLFENQAKPWPNLRNYGLDMVNSITPLKHIIMRRAMGLEGDLPIIARFLPQ